LYAAVADNAPEIDATMLVGGYAPRRAVDEIEEDHRAMLRERARDSIADR
jgi:hypothetical protein